MKYTLSRLEYNKNHEGETVSGFIAINISNGEESLCQEHWMSGEELALVLEDKTNLQPIIEKMAAEGELRLEEWIATKPMPTENALEVEGKREEVEAMIKVENITSLKTAIVAEKARVEEERLQAIRDMKPVEVLLDNGIIKE